jgi:hypothetical protein
MIIMKKRILIPFLLTAIIIVSAINNNIFCTCFCFKFENNIFNSFTAIRHSDSLYFVPRNTVFIELFSSSRYLSINYEIDMMKYKRLALTPRFGISFNNLIAYGAGPRFSETMMLNLNYRFSKCFYIDIGAGRIMYEGLLSRKGMREDVAQLGIKYIAPKGFYLKISATTELNVLIYWIEWRIFESPGVAIGYKF